MHVQPFVNGQSYATKSAAFFSGIGWAKNMMTKAVGLHANAYGYDPAGGGVSVTPNNAHPETNLCYGLLETWLRSCSRSFASSARLSAAISS